MFQDNAAPTGKTKPETLRADHYFNKSGNLFNLAPFEINTRKNKAQALFQNFLDSCSTNELLFWLANV